MDDRGERKDARPAGPPEQAEDTRSLGAILADVANDLRSLVRDELALAKAEARQAMDRIRSGITLAAVGAVLAAAGLNALVAAAILGLATVWAPWLAALVVGGATVLLGAGLAMAGLRNLRAGALLPDRTVRTVQDDVRAMKGEAR